MLSAGFRSNLDKAHNTMSLSQRLNSDNAVEQAAACTVLTVQLNSNRVDADVQSTLHSHTMPRLFDLYRNNAAVAKNACAAMTAAIEADDRCAAWAAAHPDLVRHCCAARSHTANAIVY